MEQERPKRLKMKISKGKGEKINFIEGKKKEGGVESKEAYKNIIKMVDKLIQQYKKVKKLKDVLGSRSSRR